MYVFLDGHKYSMSPYTTNDMVYDGSAMWVALSSKRVKCIKFWGDDAETVYDIDLTSELSGQAYYITYGNGKIYVFDCSVISGEHSEYGIDGWVEIDKHTREVVGKRTLIQTAHCKPTFANFKLWFVTAASTALTASDQQHLFYYDTAAIAWSGNITIPGKKQFDPRKIVWGKDQYIFVDRFNENGVAKFNTSNGAFVSSILTNRKPTAMYANSSKELLVAGKNGMITVVNQSTDATSNDYGLTAEAFAIYDDGTYLWAALPQMARLEKGALTDNYRIMDGDDKDYSIEAFSQSTFFDIFVTPPYVHQDWDVENEVIVNKTEERRVVALTSASLFVAYNLTDSWSLEEVRDYYLKVKTGAMIGTGAERYYGETA